MLKKDHDTISQCLSHALDDIGVNEQMLKKRRSMSSLNENMMSFPVKHQAKCYVFDSFADGTTTMGLGSKQHILWCLNNYKIIQNKSEWNDNAFNLLMLQDGAPPGYCRLQQMGRNKFSYESLIFFKSNMILMPTKEAKKSSYPFNFSAGQFIPENLAPKQANSLQVETVCGYELESWPLSSQDWFSAESEMFSGNWPIKDMQNHCKETSCFVVPTASKNSENTDYEWRISTQAAERYLIRTLNITQIRCYILMKMLLQSGIDPQRQNFITNYMCKTVLFHCVQKMVPAFWREDNLLSCLKYCLEELFNYAKEEYCPHFFIPENNLMPGLLASETNRWLHFKLGNLLSYENLLVELLVVEIDMLGYKLEHKLSNENVGIINPPKAEIENEISRQLLLNFVSRLYALHQALMTFVEQPFLLQHLSQFLFHLNHFEDSNIKQILTSKIAGFLCTSIATAIASANIKAKKPITHEAMFWFSGGMNSDALSSRLKFASALYCARDVQQTDSILKDIGCHHRPVNQICVCHGGHLEQRWPLDFKEGSIENPSFAGTCIKFLPYERYCAPKEMVYEMYRSNAKEKLHRGSRYQWMDWAVVDSEYYMYFLQYKVSKDLKKNKHLTNALINFRYKVHNIVYTGHRETALNLLGQCLAQEGYETEAIRCYLQSLTIQSTNNAARWHLFILLARLMRHGFSRGQSYGKTPIFQRVIFQRV